MMLIVCRSYQATLRTKSCKKIGFPSTILMVLLWAWVRGQQHFKSCSQSIQPFLIPSRFWLTVTEIVAGSGGGNWGVDLQISIHKTLRVHHLAPFHPHLFLFFKPPCHASPKSPCLFVLPPPPTLFPPHGVARRTPSPTTLPPTTLHPAHRSFTCKHSNGKNDKIASLQIQPTARGSFPTYERIHHHSVPIHHTPSSALRPSLLYAVLGRHHELSSLHVECRGLGQLNARRGERKRGGGRCELWRGTGHQKRKTE